MTHSQHDDLDDDTETGDKRVVKHVVRDLATAVKMKRVQADAEALAYKAEATTELAKVRAEERRRKQELDAEITKIKLNMSAGEKARAHIAVAGPLYLLLLIGGFIVMLATGSIPEDQVSVASALLTLLVTMIGANLRSIISESSSPADKAEGPSPTEESPAATKSSANAQS